MANRTALGGAAEPAVGDEGDGLAEPLSGDGAGGGKHFLHTRTAARAFVADDHNMAGFDFAGENALVGVVLGLEDDRGTLELHHGRRDAGGFDDGTSRREVTEQNRQSAGLRISAVKWTDDLGIFDLCRGDVFAKGLAGRRHAVEVERAGFSGDGLENGRDAAGTVDVFHVVDAGWGHLAHMRHASGYVVEVLQVEGRARLDGHGQRVQYGIGGAAHGHVKREGVFESGCSQDIARADIAPDEFDNGPAGLLEEPVAGGIGRQDRTVARQCQAERFAQTVHGIGRKHSGARTAGGAGVLLEFLQLAERYLAGRLGSDALEYRGQIDGLSCGGQFAGLHRPARDEHRGNVDSCRGHHHARHDLVAVRDADHAVEAVSAEHGLDAVGDEFARCERVFHAGVAHGDAVVNADGVEFERHAACGANGFAHFATDHVQVDMSGDDLNEGVGDGDERFVPIGVGLDHARGPQKGSMGSANGAFLDGVTDSHDSKSPDCCRKV